MIRSRSVTTPTSNRQFRVRPSASPCDVASITTASLPANWRSGRSPPKRVPLPAAGTTAQIPDHWRDAWEWSYNGIWTDHFIMSDQVFNSDAIASGDQAFFSGKVAMSTNFLWITYGLGTDYGETEGKWDIAAVPGVRSELVVPLPAVFEREGGRMEVLLDAASINACRTLDELQQLVKQASR